MNTIRLDPSDTSLKGRILAIEPDAARARALRELLKTRIHGHVDRHLHGGGRFYQSAVLFRTWSLILPF